MVWFAIVLCYLGSLVFIAYLLHLRKQKNVQMQELEKLRGEMNALAATVGLRARAQNPFGPPGM
jgi:hypothetical protein